MLVVVVLVSGIDGGVGLGVGEWWLVVVGDGDVGSSGGGGKWRW